MEDLFGNKIEETKSKTPADKAFSNSYKEMTGEIDRVSGKSFTLWGRFAMWIYSVIFGNKYHLKNKQNEFEKYRSAEAFEQVAEIFKPEKNDSMTEEEIFSHSKRKFKG